MKKRELQTQIETEVLTFGEVAKSYIGNQRQKKITKPQQKVRRFTSQSLIFCDLHKCIQWIVKASV